MTKFIAALLTLAGMGALGWSLTAATITGEHMAIIAVALFAFAGALGVWQIADRDE